MQICPICGDVIIREVWVYPKAAVKKGKTIVEEAIHAHVKTLPVPLTPMGKEHLCGEEESHA
jgi:hypothetical protein